MKKVAWAGMLAAIVSFIVWSKDPLNDTVNFIIGGTVPGTNFSIGLWSALMLAALLFLLVRKGYQRVKFQMLEHTAKQIQKEQAGTKFKKAHSGIFDPSQRSVIAAPRQKSAGQPNLS